MKTEDLAHLYNEQEQERLDNLNISGGENIELIDKVFNNFDDEN